MEIAAIAKSDFWKTGEIVPGYVLQNAARIICCRQGDKILGAAVLMKSGKAWSLIWIYLEKEVRGKGYGNALLDAAISEAKAAGAPYLGTTLDGDSDGGRLLAAMLGRRNFFLDFDSMGRVTATRDQLKGAIFFSDKELAKKLDKVSCNILPLRKVTGHQISCYVKKSEKAGNYMACHADYKGADKAKSMVLMAGEDIVGVLLAEETEPGDFIVHLGCVEKSHNLEYMLLLKRAAENLLDTEKKFKRLQFSCVNDKVLQFAKHILPECNVLWDSIVKGTYWF